MAFKDLMKLVGAGGIAALASSSALAEQPEMSGNIIADSLRVIAEDIDQGNSSVTIKPFIVDEKVGVTITPTEEQGISIGAPISDQLQKKYEEVTSTQGTMEGTPLKDLFDDAAAIPDDDCELAGTLRSEWKESLVREVANISELPVDEAAAKVAGVVDGKKLVDRKLDELCPAGFGG